LKQAQYFVADLCIERVAKEAKPLESCSQTEAAPLLVNLIIGVLWARWRTPMPIGQDEVSIFFFSFYAIALSLLFLVDVQPC
jgi:hypothetical protein